MNDSPHQGLRCLFFRGASPAGLGSLLHLTLTPPRSPAQSRWRRGLRHVHLGRGTRFGANGLRRAGSRGHGAPAPLAATSPAPSAWRPSGPGHRARRSGRRPPMADSWRSPGRVNDVRARWTRGHADRASATVRPQQGPAADRGHSAQCVRAASARRGLAPLRAAPTPEPGRSPGAPGPRPPG